MVRYYFALAGVACVFAASSSHAQSVSRCVVRETKSTNYNTSAAWIEAGKAATQEYRACLEKEATERDRLAAERQAARDKAESEFRDKVEEDQRRRAATTNAAKNAGPRGISMSDAMSIARTAVDKLGDRIVEAVVSAPGDRAAGEGGPRDSAFDKAGSIAVDAAGHVNQPNGVASRLNGIATRSSVDASSRAMGSLQAGLDSFTKGSSTEIAPSSPPSPGFAHLSEPGVTSKPATFSSIKVNGAAAKAHGGALSATTSSRQTAAGWRTDQGRGSFADLGNVPTNSSSAIQAMQSRQMVEGTRVQQAYDDQQTARAETKRRNVIAEMERKAALERQQAEAAAYVQSQIEYANRMAQTRENTPTQRKSSCSRHSCQ